MKYLRYLRAQVLLRLLVAPGFVATLGVLLYPEVPSVASASVFIPFLVGALALPRVTALITASASLLLATVQSLLSAWGVYDYLLIRLPATPNDEMVLAESPSWGLVTLWAAASLMLLWLGPRLIYLLWRMLAEQHPNGGALGKNRKLLPSQTRLVDKLVRYIDDTPHDGGRVIALEGNWGTGKSTILRGLARKLLHRQHDGGRRHAVIHFDAWRHQREPDLDRALYEQIASNPQALLTWGWLTRPFYQLLLRALFSTSRVTLRGGQVEATMDGARPTPVRYRRSLEWLVRGSPALPLLRGSPALPLLRTQRSIVVILDEVDRCSARTAQQYVTLVQRMLAIPGVVVVLPYVRAQLEYKVFNPTIVELDDLATTFQAVLWQGQLNRSRAADDYDEWGLIKTMLGELDKKRVPGNHPIAGGGGDGATRTPGWKAGTDGVMSAAIARIAKYRYLRADNATRHDYHELFQEKFTHAIPLRIPGPGAEDVRALIEHSDEIGVAIANASQPGRDTDGDPTTTRADRAMQAYYAAIGESLWLEFERTRGELRDDRFWSIRYVNASLIRHLGEAARVGAEPEALHPTLGILLALSTALEVPFIPSAITAPPAGGPA